MNKKQIAGIVVAVIALFVGAFVWGSNSPRKGTPPTTTAITTNTPPAESSQELAMIPGATLDVMYDVGPLETTEEWEVRSPSGTNTMVHKTSQTPEVAQKDMRMRETELKLGGKDKTLYWKTKIPTPTQFPSFAPTVITQLVVSPPVVTVVTQLVTAPPVIIRVTNTEIKMVTVPAPVTPAKAKPVVAPKKAKVVPTPAPPAPAPVTPAPAPVAPSVVPTVNLQITVTNTMTTVMPPPAYLFRDIFEKKK